LQAFEKTESVIHTPLIHRLLGSCRSSIAAYTSHR